MLSLVERSFGDYWILSIATVTMASSTYELVLNMYSRVAGQLQVWGSQARLGVVYGIDPLLGV